METMMIRWLKLFSRNRQTQLYNIRIGTYRITLSYFFKTVVHKAAFYHANEEDV